MYTLCKFCENHAKDTPLQGFYIPYFDQMSVKISDLGSYTLILALMGVKFVTVPSSLPNFTTIGATCCPCEVKNLKIGL